MESVRTTYSHWWYHGIPWRISPAPVAFLKADSGHAESCDCWLLSLLNLNLKAVCQINHSQFSNVISVQISYLHEMVLVSVHEICRCVYMLLFLYNNYYVVVLVRSTKGILMHTSRMLFAHQSYTWMCLWLMVLRVRLNARQWLFCKYRIQAGYCIHVFDQWMGLLLRVCLSYA